MPRWIFALVACVFASSVAGAAPARIGHSAPIIGETLTVTVDRVWPGDRIALVFDPGTGQIGRVVEVVADGSGTARFELPLAWRPLDPSAATAEQLTAQQKRSADAGMLFSRDAADPLAMVRQLQAFDLGRPGPPMIASVRVAFLAPSLLVTGQDDGGAHLYHLPLPGFPGRPERFDLGSGIPGGAVYDGRGNRVFVIADAASGDLRVVGAESPSARDLPSSRADLRVARPFLVNGAPLARDMRGIAITADGRSILISAAGEGDPTLYVIDTATDAVTAIPIDDLGADGGRVVVSDDGLYGFVAVRSLYVRQIDLVTRTPGHLLAVGSPGQDEIRDLRVIRGNLFALTGRALSGSKTDSLTGLEVANLRHYAQDGGMTAPGMTVRDEPGGDAEILLMDPTEGTIAVFDARTMQRRATYSGLPLGARDLLLPADPTSPLAALLEGEPGGSSRLRALHLGVLSSRAEGAIGAESYALGGPARALPLDGANAMGAIYVLHVGGVGLVALPAGLVHEAVDPSRPIDLAPWTLALPPDFAVSAVSPL